MSLRSASTPRSSAVLAAMTLLYFFLMADTFNALGVVLPSMVDSLHMDWGQAGFGFMLLGLGCGLTSPLPAWTIRQFGLAATFGGAALILTTGFALFAVAQGQAAYDLGAVLLGCGFTMGGSVPAVFALSRHQGEADRRMSLYFTGGGVGAVAGPLLFLASQAVFHDWRAFWWCCAVATGMSGLLAAWCVAGLRNQSDKNHPEDDHGWSVRAALRSLAFWIIVASYSGCLTINTTMHSFAVQHLTEHGLSPRLAATIMSVIAALGIAGSALAGIVSRTLGARVLACLATLAMTLAALSLALPQSVVTLGVFVLALGLGIGIIYVASAVLLLQYFGKRHNLELYAIMCFLSTLAALGPWLGGTVHNHTGSFNGIFLALALLGSVLSVALLALRPPSIASST